MDSESYVSCIEDYLKWQTRRNRRPDTIRSYRVALYNLFGYLHRSGMECDPHRIGEDEIIFFVTTYEASETTIHYYIKALAVMLKHLGNTIIEEMGLLWNDEVHPNVKWISREEFEKVVEAATHPTDRMIVMLAGYAGLRRGEIANLKVSDILSDRLIITGKGHGRGKQRVIPKTRKLSAEIERYMIFREEILGGKHLDDFLIAYRRGRPITGFVPDSISQRIRFLCVRAGVDASTHSFRRFFATEVWDRMPNKDIRVLQALMGHTSVAVTARYIRQNDDALVEAMERL